MSNIIRETGLGKEKNIIESSQGKISVEVKHSFTASGISSLPFEIEGGAEIVTLIP